MTFGNNEHHGQSNLRGEAVHPSGAAMQAFGCTVSMQVSRGDFRIGFRHPEPKAACSSAVGCRGAKGIRWGHHVRAPTTALTQPRCLLRANWATAVVGALRDRGAPAPRLFKAEWTFFRENIRRMH